jgi:predicted kinase
MPKCYQLIGVPGSGKSTWARDQEWFENCAYVSTDEFVEEYAKSQGKTYSEVFTDYMPTAVNLMAGKVIEAREAGKDIIWDQTSTTVKSRTRKFNMLPNYEHVAVVFTTPSRIELKRRLDSRPGKEIPEVVVEGMIVSFETPTTEEGFNEIWYT